MIAKIERLLITGGCGFIGSNLVRYVLRVRPDWLVTNLDCLSYSGNRENLRDVERSPNYRFVQGNINDRELVQPLVAEADAIVHLAAESHVDRSIRHVRPFVETNVLGTQTLLESAKTAWRHDEGDCCGKFVHVSTDEVYGSLDLDSSERFTESSLLAPSNPYSASKAAGDLLAQAYHKTHGLNVTITRCSNNFGPFQFPEKVIPRFVTNMLDGEPAPLYGDGRHTRDWLHVEDHCEALLAALEHGGVGEIYNVGADNEHSNLELTRQILELLGRDDSAVQYVADRPAHDVRYSMDSTKIREKLGWTPTRSDWPRALAETVRWYVENESWWRPLKPSVTDSSTTGSSPGRAFAE